jgi:WD40 repeat protein
MSTKFTKAINIQSGKLLSWPAPPLEWVGHHDSVYCMTYSPDGSHIVTGSDDRTIRIWDAETGAVVGEALEGHTGSVRSVAYSPNGLHIISGSDDHTIRIWDAKTGDAVGKPLDGNNGAVWSVAYSPDGRHIISGSEIGPFEFGMLRLVLPLANR